MRKFVSACLTAAMIVLGMPVGSFAASAARLAKAKRQDQPTGTIKGDAKNANGQTLSRTKVRIRNSSTGNIAADLTTDANGSFVGVVPAGSYVIEIVGANGAVIGLSPVLTVAAGATATISVTASAVAAVAGAAGAGAASGGGFGVFGLGTITSIAVLGGAATATVFGIKAATKNDNNNNGTPVGQVASPAR
jgi:hypothetical protein